MQVQKDSIVAGVPKDKFLIQSMIAPVGLSVEDITSEMVRFNPLGEFLCPTRILPFVLVWGRGVRAPVGFFWSGVWRLVYFHCFPLDV